jgi:putative membrane protein
MSGNRELSIERIVRAGVYVIFGSACLLLVATGRISAVLHPRMHPWIVTTGLLFLSMAAREIWRIHDAPRVALPILCYYALLFVILVTALYPDIGRRATGMMVVKTRTAVAREAPAPPQSGLLAPDDDHYWSLFNAVYDDPRGYAGRQMTVAGFICRQPRFPDGVALVARNLIWCCTADKGLIGFMAAGGEISQAPPGAWVEVGGILDTISFDVAGRGSEKPVPIIRVQKIRLLRDHPSENIFPL